MILTVHDELLFEVPKTDADELSAVVRHHMQSAAVLAVPLTVDVGIGENWKAAKGEGQCLPMAAATGSLPRARASDLAPRHRPGRAQGALSPAAV